MQQCRAGEIVVRRLEIGAGVNQRGVRRDQAAQPLEIAGIDRGDGVVETRVRLERGDPARRLDVALEPRPVVEAILPRKDQLRIGQRERPVEDRSAVSGLSSVDDARRCARGGRVPLAMRTTQLVGLDLELGEVGTWTAENGWAWYAPFARARCPRAGRKKRGRIVQSIRRRDSVPFRGREALHT